MTNITMPVQQSLRILVIIPAHNEAGRIAGVVRAVHHQLPDAHIAVINDDSRDTTAREAEHAGAMVLPHATNLGYGAALETGYLFAGREDYDCILQMDGDGQHLAEELPALLKPIMENNADLVLGSRYLKGSGTFQTPPIRRLGQVLFGGLLRLFTGHAFSDPTTGFQALSRRAITFFSSGVFPCDYPDADVLLMAHLAGLRIREVPVKMVSRQGGISMHSGLKPVYYAMKMMLSIGIVLLNFYRWKSWRKRLNAVSPRSP